MQIPIMNGIYADSNSDFRSSYPVNLVPVPKEQGISQGYLRPAEGIEFFAETLGSDRGGINWNGLIYRVSGQNLIRVNSDGSIIQIGIISGTDTVSLDYSFDNLIIAADEKLYYYNGASLTQNTDPDLGVVLDAIWVDGYTMTTDGENIVVTELNNPYEVNPLKYGSSEVDPDPVLAILKVRNEPHVLNRYSIEVFENVGGSNFPFRRIDGAQIQRGVIGTHACCVFTDRIAFLGSGRKEAISIYLGDSGSSSSIATREINKILKNYSEKELKEVVLESRVFDSHYNLYVHLPDKTLVYDANASSVVGQSIWYILHSDKRSGKFSQYRARHFVYCYGKWFAGDPTDTKIGCMTDKISSHYGEQVCWEFGIKILYNEGRGAIIHSLELVVLSGNSEFNTENFVSCAYTKDGVNWSQEKFKKVSQRGDTKKRLVWISQGSMKNFRMQRFRGTSRSHLSFARLEANIESLTV